MTAPTALDVDLPPSSSSDSLSVSLSESAAAAAAEEEEEEEEEEQQQNHARATPPTIQTPPLGGLWSRPRANSGSEGAVGDSTNVLNVLRRILNELGVAEQEAQGSSSARSALGVIRRQRTRLQLLLEQKTQELQDRPRRLHGHIRRVVTGDENKRVRDHLLETSRKPRVIRYLDKCAFTGGVVNLMATEYVLLMSPDHFWIWYSLIMPTLLLLRYPYYRKRKMHYFLWDFCYFTQASLLLFLLFAPGDCTWFKVNWTYAMGPLAWAVPAWRNSLVFHDMQKITSVYIHIFPALTCITIRWLASNPRIDLDGCGSIGLWDATVGFLGYVAWQLAYFLKTEVIERTALDADPDIQTSLRWMTMDDKSSISKFALRWYRLVRIMGPEEKFKPTEVKTKVLFMLSQLVYSIITTLPVPLMYANIYATCIFMVIILGFAIWNGYVICCYSQGRCGIRFDQTLLIPSQVQFLH
jgi:hypothetical protein